MSFLGSTPPRRVVLRGASWSVPAILVASAAPAFATSPPTAVPGPLAYRAEHYFSGGRFWSYVFFTTAPGAIAYEVNFGESGWTPLVLQADWGTEAMGMLDSDTCPLSGGCAQDSTIQVRAWTADGPGNPGNVFPSTYYDFG